jgi:hypothetical protein
MSRKRHFVRYNPVSDSLESYSGRKRPAGTGWVQLPIDFCCAIPIPACGGSGDTRTFVIETPNFLAGCSNSAALYIDGLRIGNAVTGSYPGGLQSMIDDLNGEYNPFAVFSIINTNQIQVVVLDDYEGITLQTDVTCE